MSTPKVSLTFDASATSIILDALGKSVDKEGYIVEKDNPDQRVFTVDGDEVLVSEFAGVYKNHNGSEVFVKSDIVSLIEASELIDMDW